MRAQLQGGEHGAGESQAWATEAGDSRFELAVVGPQPRCEGEGERGRKGERERGREGERKREGEKVEERERGRVREKG